MAAGPQSGSHAGAPRRHRRLRRRPAARCRRAPRGLRRRRAGGRRARARRGGYRVTLASRTGGTRPGRERPRPRHRAAPRPSATHRHAGPRRAACGAATAAARRELARLDPGRPRRAAGGWPPCARAPSSAPRPASSRAAGSPPTGPAPASWPRRIPELTVDPDPIYIRDGKYWSSAGVTAGIDLSLALVQEDLGVDVAQTVARWLVMFLHRPGGPDAVRLAGLGAPGRALDRAGRADPRGSRRPAATTGSRPSPRRRP